MWRKGDRRGSVDAVLLTSPMAAEPLFEGGLPDARFVAIGPTTAAELARRGFDIPAAKAPNAAAIAAALRSILTILVLLNSSVP